MIITSIELFQVWDEIGFPQQGGESINIIKRVHRDQLKKIYLKIGNQSYLLNDLKETIPIEPNTIKSFYFEVIPPMESGLAQLDHLIIKYINPLSGDQSILEEQF